MITYIKLSNFRSIERDTVDLDRPITVIVGPNGAGKTNLLLALRCVANTIKYGPSRAVQLAGGLDQVFRTIERRTQKCSFEIGVRVPNRHGSHQEVYHPVSVDAPPRGYSELVYEFSLRYDEENKRLLISSESLRAEDGEIFLDRSQTLATFTDSQAEQIKPDLQRELEDSLLLSSIGYLNRAKGHQQLPPAARQAIRDAQVELANIADHNLNPLALRQESDLLTHSDLKYDGSGLSSFLYRLKEGKFFFFASPYPLIRKHERRLWGELVETVGEVLPFIKSIETKENIDSTTVALGISENHAPRSYNVRQVSDGSLKYVGMAAKILTGTYSLLSLEEIENCLHPRAITVLLDLMRSCATRFSSQFVITTHSESVLNQCRPEEILIATRDDRGRTKYRPPRNLSTLRQELEAGGFGLGTYWGSHEGLTPRE